jgi:hypothetical protein
MVDSILALVTLSTVTLPSVGNPVPVITSPTSIVPDTALRVNVLVPRTHANALP